jgi:ribonuclease J
MANGDLAQATGVPAENVLIAEDGNVVDLHKGRARIVGKVDAGYIFVDGTTVGDISEASLTDRKILGEEGFISVVTVVDIRSQRIISGPDVHARGFVEDDSAFDSIRPQLAAALESALADGVDDSHRLQQLIRRKLGKWVNDTYRRRPMIVPVVVEA